MLNASKPLSRQARFCGTGFRGAYSAATLTIVSNVLRLTPTASADDIDQFVLCEIVHPLPHFGWGLGILTEFIGESLRSDNR